MENGKWKTENGKHKTKKCQVRSQKGGSMGAWEMGDWEWSESNPIIVLAWRTLLVPALRAYD